jgi:hypothetical protein
MEAVRRNAGRFPEDLMFEMSPEEFSDWGWQIASSKSDRQGHIMF